MFSNARILPGQWFGTNPLILSIHGSSSQTLSRQLLGGCAPHCTCKAFTLLLCHHVLLCIKRPRHNIALVSSICYLAALPPSGKSFNNSTGSHWALLALHATGPVEFASNFFRSHIPFGPPGINNSKNSNALYSHSRSKLPFELNSR